MLYLARYVDGMQPVYRAYVWYTDRVLIDRWQAHDYGQAMNCIVDLDEMDVCALVLKGVKVARIGIIEYDRPRGFDGRAFMLDGIVLDDWY